MTHPTYTHPGANAALLNISRTLRRVKQTRRERSLKGDRQSAFAMIYAEADFHTACKMLEFINDHNDPVNKS